MKNIWIHEYSPELPEEVQGQDKPLKTLIDFLTSKKKAIFLYGATGVGKTSSVYAAAKKLSLEVVEINASDYRTKDQILEKLGNAIFQRSLFSESKLILVDEVDGLSGTKDRGGIAAIVSLIKKTTFPIVLTANDPFNKKFSSLRKICQMLEYHTLNYLSIAKILKRIAKTEGIEYDESVIKALSRRAGGDARAAINDFQFIVGGKKSIVKEDLEILAERQKVEPIYQALMKVFKTKDLSLALSAFENVNEDPGQILLWLDENIPKEYLKPNDLANAFDMLSRADVFMGRIRRRQYWRFLVYVLALASGGVALAKAEKYKGFTSYKQSMRPLKIWQAKMKNEKKKALAEKIAEHTHTSNKRALTDNYPYFAYMVKSGNKEIARELELTKEELSWLS